MAAVPLPIPSHSASRPATPRPPDTARSCDDPDGDDREDESTVEMDLDTNLAMANLDGLALALPSLSHGPRERSDTAWSESSDVSSLQTPQTPSILAMLGSQRSSRKVPTFASPWTGGSLVLSETPGSSSSSSGSNSWAGSNAPASTSYSISPKTILHHRDSEGYFQLGDVAHADNNNTAPSSSSSSSPPPSVSNIATQEVGVIYPTLLPSDVPAAMAAVAAAVAAAAAAPTPDSPSLGPSASPMPPGTLPPPPSEPLPPPTSAPASLGRSSLARLSSDLLQLTSPGSTPSPADSVHTPPHPRRTSIGAAVRRGIDNSTAPFRRRRATLETDDPSHNASSSTDGRRRSLKELILQRRNRAHSVSSTSSSMNNPAAGPSMVPSLQLSTIAPLANGMSPLLDAPPFEGPREATAPLLRRPTPPFNVVLTTAGLQSLSAPAGSDELVWGTLSYRAPIIPSVDHFSSRLPRELKVAVFQALLESWRADGHHGRWDGDNGGRRELVRLSRVSKEWRSLCFDGQLWVNADFEQFGNVLHPATLRQILTHSSPCVKKLSLHGLDAVTSWALTVRSLFDVPELPLLPAPFSSLQSLDFRGCHTLSSSAIMAIIQVSPGLKKLNLKGIRTSMYYVLLAVRQYVVALEDLDVSRCWRLDFRDIDIFIGGLNDKQKQAMRVLRIAGLRPNADVHLLRTVATELPNLHTLDMLGCRALSIHDIQDYIDGLGDERSPLTHLNISSCTYLTPEALELLIGRLPEVTHFEAAGLEAVFHLDPPATLAQLVRTMPKLERLDLDRTGRYGGVCDRLLLELIPGACRGSPLTESHLVELRIGSAKNVTADVLLRLVNALPALGTLEADGTDADNAVVRAFLRTGRNSTRNPDSLVLVDCHALTEDRYHTVAPRTRARRGWDSHLAAPFDYSAEEMNEAKPVFKTFWAWRATPAPKLWREARAAREVADAKRRRVSASSGGSAEDGSGGEARSVVRSWWRADDFDDMERGTCVVM